MPNVIACLLPYHLERGRGDVDDPACLDPRQPLQQVPGALEPRAQGHRIAAGGLPRVRLRSRRATPLREVVAALLGVHRRRTVVGLCLMASQAFFYNAIFFTYALVLTDFFGITADAIGWYLLPFAAGNFLGPLLLGRLFDTWGRRPMISLSYLGSAAVLAATAEDSVRYTLRARATESSTWQ